MTVINWKKINKNDDLVKKFKIIEKKWKYNIGIDENNTLFKKWFDKIENDDSWYFITIWDEKYLLEKWTPFYINDWLMPVFNGTDWPPSNYIDQNGNLLLEEDLDAFTHFYNGYALVWVRKKWLPFFIIDSNWKKILEINYDEYDLNWIDNDNINEIKPFVFWDKDKKVHIFDTRTQKLFIDENYI